MRRTRTALPRVSPIMQPMNSVGYERYWSARKRRAWSDRISRRTIGAPVVPPALRAHAESTSRADSGCRASNAVRPSAATTMRMIRLRPSLTAPSRVRAEPTALRQATIRKTDANQRRRIVVRGRDATPLFGARPSCGWCAKPKNRKRMQIQETAGCCVGMSADCHNGLPGLTDLATPTPTEVSSPEREVTSMQTSGSTASAVSAGRKPRDDEIDVYGLTHPGKVRRENQDHFLISSLQKRVQVHLTSLPTSDLLSQHAERLAFFAMVADGVGGSAGGEEASRLAVAAITRYVTQAMHCYYSVDLADEERFPRALEEAALRVHSEIQGSSPPGPLQAYMATTLTLWIGLWPRAYLLHVGDSRCYLLRNGQLMQLSRDQTLAQDLVDRGVFRRSDALKSPFANVLSSSLGGPQTAPIVTDMQQEWGNAGLLCSDGLTKHVPDSRIRERLLAMTSAKQGCEDLLRDALDAGGTDNVTVVVGRTLRQDAT